MYAELKIRVYLNNSELEEVGIAAEEALEAGPSCFCSVGHFFPAKHPLPHVQHADYLASKKQPTLLGRLFLLMGFIL